MIALHSMGEHAAGIAIGPLYVDLDGTLIATDLLHESMLQLARANPCGLLRLPGWLVSGKARLKHEIAYRTELAVDTLPYRAEVMALVHEARAAGRRVVLATASDGKFAHQVAEHLGVFDAVIASDGQTNRDGVRKLAAIVQDAGGEGAPFCYAGDSAVDLPIWRRASAAVVVSASPALLARVAAVTRVERVVAPEKASLRQVLFGLRLHQWLKNLLIALPVMPVLGSVNPQMLVILVLAFLAFGLMASAIYVINDLLDLEADRKHPRKRHRPFASGRLSVPMALATSAMLCTASLAVSAVALPLRFTACLLFYVALTSAYSVQLKRRAVVDVVVLAALYTVRIVAGAAALALPLTPWILGFSTFLFLSLALAKRYVEIAMANDQEGNALGARGYQVSDLQFVMAAGLAAGQIAVLVLCLYLNDSSVMARYRHPQYLWLVAPMLLFWVLRIWLKASRKLLHDDPVVFAARDWVSRLIVVLSALLAWLSI